MFSPEEAKVFIAQPYAEDAVRLRQWDDLAKVEGAVTPPLAHFVAAIEAAQRPEPASAASPSS
jgi:predicted HD phosphohydrolase